MFTAFICFHTVFLPEDDPRGLKHAALLNTINLVVLTVLIYIFSKNVLGAERESLCNVYGNKQHSTEATAHKMMLILGSCTVAVFYIHYYNSV